MKGVEVVMVAGLLMGIAAEVTMATRNNNQKEGSEEASSQVKKQEIGEEEKEVETLMDAKEGFLKVKSGDSFSQAEIEEIEAEHHITSEISQPDENQPIKEPSGEMSIVTKEGESQLDQNHLQSKLEDKLDKKRREGRLFALYTTTSIKRLATTTITAISTCLSTVAAPTCGGRRRRAFLTKLNYLEGTEDLSTQLMGSQKEDYQTPVSSPDDNEGASLGRVVRQVVQDGRDGRKLTIWSTFISTLTVTSTSYVVGTTITASALCAAPNLVAGCFGR